MKTVNNCFQAKGGELNREWFIVDATDQVLGRLAARVSQVLMGKHKPTYTPHVDTGDFVIVTNCEKIKVTGRKRENIIYHRYSGYPSGLKEIPFERMHTRSPETVVHEAVRRMMPKNALAAHMMKKLKLYAGDQHPHQAQSPKTLA